MLISSVCQALLCEIDPSSIKQYLIENGWETFDVKRDDISVFQRIAGRTGRFEQITIPNDSTLSDYATALYQAVATIADVEKKPVEQMLFSFLGEQSGVMEIETSRILGRVVELKAAPSPESRKVGCVKILYQDETGKTGVLNAVLSAENYEKAIDAHKKGAWVSLEGAILPEDRSMDCRLFEFIPEHK